MSRPLFTASAIGSCAANCGCLAARTKFLGSTGSLQAEAVPRLRPKGALSTAPVSFESDRRVATAWRKRDYRQSIAMNVEEKWGLLGIELETV